MLVLDDGQVLVLDDGQVSVLHDGQVLVLDDGQVLVLDDGQVLVLDDGQGLVLVEVFHLQNKVLLCSHVGGFVQQPSRCLCQLVFLLAGAKKSHPFRLTP